LIHLKKTFDFAAYLVCPNASHFANTQNIISIAIVFEASGSRILESIGFPKLKKTAECDYCLSNIGELGGRKLSLKETDKVGYTHFSSVISRNIYK